GQRLRPEVLAFIRDHPDALQRPVPDKPAPFSTPRAWASLARALDLVDAEGALTPTLRLALAAGRVSAGDAEAFCRFTGHRGPLSAEPGKVAVSLSQAKTLIRCLAAEQSLLLQAAPGVGKTAIVAEAAAEAGVPWRSGLVT